MKTGIYLSTVLITFMFLACSGQDEVRTGAEQLEFYLPSLQGKRIGIVANQTSMISGTHLVDSLNSLVGEKTHTWKVFSPEHGFRGEAEYGELVDDGVDSKTGLKVISLYGRNRKPSDEDLEDIDIVLFDVQDVGVRFYTYISTLFYVMQACAENNLELMVLDRPNPNGFYVDGPVLEPEFSSFVGLHEVPVVYGMTIAEYAKMINGEGWLGEGMQCRLQVIPCLNYDHSIRYSLPVPPSPNLPNMNSVYLYPSTGFFEGTVISEGRGTDAPFEVFGHPSLMGGDYSFIPESRPGASTHPKLVGKLCRGRDLRYFRDTLDRDPCINLSWLIYAYENFPEKEKFFIPYFENLAGTSKLRQQIVDGLSETEIRASWEDDISAFRKIRQKYLMYPE
ncbi:exo-beta-N-acetylmuramidase NamZ domain-containing protein [Bacteroidota bacterium]